MNCRVVLPISVGTLIIRPVLRRVHMARLVPGRITLSQADTHHVRDVLRLRVGDSVELFDDAGASSTSRIVRSDAQVVEVEVGAIGSASDSRQLVIAAAIPKGERADWMIEKLCELGVTHFVPVIASRSVVVPAGRNK